MGAVMGDALWNPGGPAAKGAGCTCPAEFNGNGELMPPEGWAIALDCRIHGPSRDLAISRNGSRDYVIIEPGWPS